MGEMIREKKPKSKAKGWPTKTYRTWREFRVALNRHLAEPLPTNLWVVWEELLYSAAIHEPFSDGDIEFALHKIKRLRKMYANGKRKD